MMPTAMPFRFGHYQLTMLKNLAAEISVCACETNVAVASKQGRIFAGTRGPRKKKMYLL